MAHVSASSTSRLSMYQYTENTISIYQRYIELSNSGMSQTFAHVLITRPFFVAVTAPPRLLPRHPASPA
jgi:hypothetical protein